MKGMRRREEKEIGEPNKGSGWEKSDDAGVMRRRGMTSAEKRSKKKKALIYRKDVLTTPRVGFNEFESLCICQQGSFVFLCLFVFVICVFFVCVGGYSNGCREKEFL